MSCIASRLPRDGHITLSTDFKGEITVHVNTVLKTWDHGIALKEALELAFIPFLRDAQAKRPLPKNRSLVAVEANTGSVT